MTANPFEHAEHVGRADPTGQPARVFVAQRRVLDRRNQRHRAVERTDAAFRNFEIEAGEHAANRELEERLPTRHQIAHCRIALGDPQFAWVHAVGADGDEGMRHELLVAFEGAQRCLLPGRITVEGEDDFAGVLGRIEQQSAQQTHVFVTERRATGCDGGGDASEMAGHHVGVSLDDHGLPGFGHLALGQIDAVEHLTFLVQRGFWGVQILRPIVVIAQFSGAEADDVASDIADRPHQPAAEPIDDAALPATCQTAGGQLVVGEPTATQMLDQMLPTVGRVADTELGRRGCVKASFVEEGAADDGFGAGQLLGVILRGQPVRLDKTGPLALLRTGSRTTLLVVQFVVRPRSSRSTASVNESWSIFCTKLMTSPPSPQPKQCQNPRAGVTLNDGDRSS